MANPTNINGFSVSGSGPIPDYLQLYLTHTLNPNNVSEITSALKLTTSSPNYAGSITTASPLASRVFTLPKPTQAPESQMPIADKPKAPPTDFNEFPQLLDTSLDEAIANLSGRPHHNWSFIQFSNVPQESSGRPAYVVFFCCKLLHGDILQLPISIDCRSKSCSISKNGLQFGSGNKPCWEADRRFSELLRPILPNAANRLEIFVTELKKHTSFSKFLGILYQIDTDGNYKDDFVSYSRANLPIARTTPQQGSSSASPSLPHPSSSASPISSYNQPFSQAFPRAAAMNASGQSLGLYIRPSQ